MNVYDWDGTIYKGDSTVDFVFYLYTHYPKTLCNLPRTLFYGLGYALKLTPKLKFKENLYHMFTYVKDIDKVTDEFTSSNLDHVKKWYLDTQKEDDVVIINTISKKEIILVIGSQLFLFWAYYFLLKMFNTDLLILSSCSIVTSVLASYFEARRSELSLFCYIANDLILITLWIIPIIKGNTTLISVLVGPILLLINDIYGSYNWKKLKNKQKEKLIV